MSNVKKGGDDEDDGSAITKAEDAKSSALLHAHSKLKIAFRGSDLAVDSGRREAAQAKNPPKDMPIDQPPTGDTRHALHIADGAPLSGRAQDDDGDDDGDSGRSGKGDTGGGPSPDMDFAAAQANYASFADKSDNGKAAKAEKNAKEADAQQKANAEQRADGPADAKIKSKGPDAAVQTSKSGAAVTNGKSGPAAPGKSGGKGGGSAPSPGGMG